MTPDGPQALLGRTASGRTEPARHEAHRRTEGPFAAIHQQRTDLRTLTNVREWDAVGDSKALPGDIGMKPRRRTAELGTSPECRRLKAGARLPPASPAVGAVVNREFGGKAG